MPCCEHLLRYVWTDQRWPSGCPWCGRAVEADRAGRYHPHADLDPDSPIAYYARRCRGSGRCPLDWQPDYVTDTIRGEFL